MTIGILEVLLVEAKGLKNHEFFGGGTDPYVVLRYKNQEYQSSIARGQGSTPVWNERFELRVEYPEEYDCYKLHLKLMDYDTFSADDYLGETTIYLKDLLELGVENGSSKMIPTKYSIVGTDETYCGEIKVGLTFTPKVEDEIEVDKLGGWKQSHY